MNWQPLTENSLPPDKDRYYLFGGLDWNNKFVYDIHRYHRDGTIGGVLVKVKIREGVTHWCDVTPPTDLNQRCNKVNK